MAVEREPRFEEMFGEMHRDHGGTREKGEGRGRGACEHTVCDGAPRLSERRARGKGRVFGGRERRWVRGWEEGGSGEDGQQERGAHACLHDCVGTRGVTAVVLEERACERNVAARHDHRDRLRLRSEMRKAGVLRGGLSE
eukprot:3254792-Pleurochrysis_carterae.AAC.1